MYKSKLILLSCMVFSSSVSHAANETNEPNEPEPLQLQCSINISNYNGVDHASISKDVKLTQLKHKPGGTALVSQTDDYEFWVMTHGQQTINNVKFFKNFQVAIKSKKTSLFMHALSDTSNDPNKKPIKARLSLIKYFEGSFLEDGELLFECMSK